MKSKRFAIALVAAAALSLAGFLREEKLHDVYANVTRKGCSSACVFILASAFHRSVNGPVGVHRPYLSEETVREMGYEDLQQTYDALLPTIRTFFRTVNVRESLADEMWQVPDRHGSAGSSARVGLLSR